MFFPPREKKNLNILKTKKNPESFIFDTALRINVTWRTDDLHQQQNLLFFIFFFYLFIIITRGQSQ